MDENEYKKLRVLFRKVKSRNATTFDITDFTSLLFKLAPHEVDNILQQAGFSSKAEFLEYSNTTRVNEDIVKGLLIVGAGLLIAYLASR